MDKWEVLKERLRNYADDRLHGGIVYSIVLVLMKELEDAEFSKSLLDAGY